MNKDRRKRLDDLYERIEAVKSDMESLVADLGDVRDEEQESFDNLSEGLQQSEQGQQTEAAADVLNNAHSELEEMQDSGLQQILDYIDEARA